MTSKTEQLFFRTVDNAPLVLFRILFGGIMAWHCFDYMLSGALYHNYIEPSYTYTFIGFEWLQPLPGYGMYYYFSLMALTAVLVMAGIRYRLNLGIFTLLWTGAYLMQKTLYNNHYYLIMLIGIIMMFLPANADVSVDSYLNPEKRKKTMPVWYTYVFMLQIFIVYFFAALAKLYPGWLNGTFMGLMLDRFRHPWFIPLFHNHWFLLFISWGGFFFDLTIFFLLLFKRTRTLAVLACIGFHTFNWLFLDIGIFPFFALSFVVFFYPPEKVRRFFFSFSKNREAVKGATMTKSKKILYWFFIPYFAIQIALPLRHHFIKGDVLWTEEGHRLSWRMMLRLRYGTTTFKVIDRETGETLTYDLKKHFTKRQINNMVTKPDMIWQTAQKMKADFVKEGKKIAVYATTEVNINKGVKKVLIDPEADLASAKWMQLCHNEWVLLYDE